MCAICRFSPDLQSGHLDRKTDSRKTFLDLGKLPSPSLPGPFETTPCLALIQDPPEYFRPGGGLLSWDMHLRDLVDKSAPHQQVVHSVNNSQAVPRQRSTLLDQHKMGHFNLVNAQIQQVGQ